mgnify:CR=1 FL=1
MTEGGMEVENPGLWLKKRCFGRAGLEEMAISGNASRWCGSCVIQSLSFDCSAITSLLARYSSEKRQRQMQDPPAPHFLFLFSD